MGKIIDYILYLWILQILMFSIIVNSKEIDEFNGDTLVMVEEVFRHGAREST